MKDILNRKIKIGSIIFIKVGAEEIVRLHVVSSSPLTGIICGKSVGDRFLVESPSGELQVEVLDVQ